MKNILNLITFGLPSLLTIIAANPAQVLVTHIPSWEISSIALKQQLSQNQSQSKLNQGRVYFQREEFAQAAQIWIQAAQDYEIRGDTFNQALSLSYLSLAYQQLSQWESAQTAINQSLNLIENNSHRKAILWAQILNTKASLLSHTGHKQSALETFQRAQKYYEEAGDTIGVAMSQINQAQVMQSLGFYHRAKILLDNLNQQLATSEDSLLKVATLRSLGIALQVRGDLTASEEVLQQSLDIAQRLGANSQIGITLLSLANTALDMGNIQKAMDYFQRSEKIVTNPEEKLRAKLGQLHIHIQSQKWQAANDLTLEIYQKLRQLDSSRASVYGAINLSSSWQKMGKQAKSLSLSQVNQMLAQAVEYAQKLQDAQAQAYTLHQWGKLYSGNGQVPEAVKLTQQSLTIAQEINAAEITSQSAWQLGKLYKQQGESKRAIAAYTEAVEKLKSLRGDLASVNPDLQFSFRESVEPVYRELVELLLESNPSQDYLKQARQLIEDLQLAELDNFFREACLDANVAQIDEIDATATVIYPIILPERLAVIVSTPGQPIGYYSTAISATEVNAALDDFSQHLNPIFDQSERLPYLQKVYNWLIAPAESQGILADTETLVFVLDGKLRNLPMATLHSGEQYLVEKYNVSLSIGLQLLDSQPLQEEEFTMITGGLSEARQGFQALPGVKLEIEQIAQTVNPGSVMLDAQFNRSTIVNEMSSKNANVVHFATHGQFSSNAEETFLLTWEDKIQVKELDQLLRSQELVGETGIDLLVLSACQTAAGDERAVLGIAGFAIRSGARSTLATLWSVRDLPTALLMTRFYEYLQQQGMTKAEALRKAQLDLINHPNFNEPIFWAPFVLVGNWL